MRDDGSWPVRSERGVQHGWLAAVVRHAARDLAQTLVSPHQGAHVRHTGKTKIVCCENRLDERERDGRLEVAGYEVCRCRDVVGIRDVCVSTREGIFLCVLGV